MGRLHDDLCSCWEAGKPMRPGGLELTGRAVTLCDFPSDARLLDVGCGMGSTVEYLAKCLGYRAFGVDPSLSLLHKGLEKNGRLPLLCGSAERLPLAAAAFDGVFLECSLSVCADREQVLAECGRVLKKGGCLVVSDLYRRNSSVDHSAGYIAGALSREPLCASLAALGFRLKFWEDHTDELKFFAAQLILSGSPAASLWGLTPDRGGGSCPVSRGGKPGYFLLVAEWTGVESAFTEFPLDGREFCER